METLENYFTEEHHINLRDISDIEELLMSAAKSYSIYFDSDKKLAWPYEIFADSQKDPTYPVALSISTTSMILNSLLRLVNLFKASDSKDSGNISKGSVFPVPVKEEASRVLKERMIEASTFLLDNILEKTGDDFSFKDFKSTTFGTKDVFSLAWLAEVSLADWTHLQKDDKPRWDKVKDCAKEEAEGKLSGCGRFRFPPDALFDGNGSTPLEHAFPALRLVQIIRQIDGKDRGALSEHYAYFEKTLHEQLSFSQIPDSRFDPAELMFCLEGMLLCQKNVVDRTLFDRVLEVLTTVQHENAYWRPVKPYLATAQGLALFPVSIEVANSLLRACSIFDDGQLHGTYSAKSIALLRRYWQWLRARAVRFTPDGVDDDLVGWHSEHVNDPNVIHLWETSQVIEFLLAYRNALQLHVARKTLVLSRFTNKPFKLKSWSDIIGFESVTDLGPRLQIYKDIDESFIQTHIENKKKKNYSMLLYGPPGTGKTFIAQNIAKGLGRPLIEITVSDFLAGGGAQVEARAKNIFEVLMAQPSCVVLFDEIDHFLLDRDSLRYSNIDTLFQFMTPGMLTKIDDLRKKESVVFIIATNYEDRIDSAIKRIGRIDRKYLVLPPDFSKRKGILSVLDSDENIFDAPLTDQQLILLSEASVFLGFNDIEDAVRLARTDEIKDVGEFVVSLDERARTTSLETYSSRFFSSEDKHLNARETPLGEFLCLVALRLQNTKEMEKSEEVVLKAAAKVICESNAGVTEVNIALIRKYAPELGPDLLQSVVDALNVTLAVVEVREE